ncbi:PIG-L family deacetylase, partial [Candidatus Poribacteria bacterium]|nr:PIG-L family deacetylase [Candidatus Poribacteria bacterium]
TETEEAIVRRRHDEAHAAARLIDGEYVCVGEQDFLIHYDPATIRKTVEALRRLRPDVVVTHSPADYMLDHEITSQLVRNACFCAGAPNMQTLAVPPAEPLSGIPHLYYADPIEGMDALGNRINASLIVDITDAIPRKVEMLACHASQRDWLMKHHGMDEYIESMKRWGAEVGERIGAPFAEGFRQHLGHAYPQDDLIGKTLGGTRAEPREKE